MPLVNLTHLGLNSSNQQQGVISTLDRPIGNNEFGAASFLTGATRAIPTEAADLVAPTIRQLLLSNIDVATWMAAEGHVFYAAGAAQNTTLTGQTSFAATTPTLLLDVPAGTVAVPLLIALGQTGTVAGDAISILVEVDDVTRFSSGSALTSFNSMTRRSPAPYTARCTVYTTATAAAGMGVRLMGITVAQDVAPAEGISNELIWTPSGADFVWGPSSVLVYTYAATTGPTFFPTFKWLEYPIARHGF